jgi:hypothetical protein
MDPGETQNVVAHNRAIADKLREALRQFERQLKGNRRGAGSLRP